MTDLRFYSVIVLLLTFSLTGCDREHAGATITEFTGDYRYYAEIAEFFDCDSAKKYYVSDSKEHQKVIAEYLNLGLKEKEDAYLKVKGYFKETPQMEGVDPETEFVPTELISVDASRGCTKGRRVGG
jgi:uncharacterized lipoprotein YehR (DUF1307 family)